MHQPTDHILLQIEVGGVQTSAETLASLEDWLRREGIPGFTSAVATRPPSPGEMGIDPATLSIILGSQALVALVQSIHVWIKASRPEATVTLKNGTQELHVSVRNVPNTNALVKEFLADSTPEA